MLRYFITLIIALLGALSPIMLGAGYHPSFNQCFDAREAIVLCLHPMRLQAV